jgi:hypothetical protein
MYNNLYWLKSPRVATGIGRNFSDEEWSMKRTLLDVVYFVGGHVMYGGFELGPWVYGWTPAKWRGKLY